MKYNNSGKSNIGLIIFLFLVLAGLIAGVMYGLHRVGFYNAQELFYPLLSKVGLADKPQYITGNLIESEILAQRDKALNQKEEELKKITEDLKKKEEELKEKDLKLQQKEKDLMDKDRAILDKQAEADNEIQKLKKLAFYFSSMKPDESSKILENMPEELVIQILKNIPDQKTAAVIIMKMEKKKAGDIMRKMSR
ncbi:hypothetical protein KA977_13195 [Candidatus Dependentiae bacterium]|nr:hypothetical protein [Candidatus Dependentiae bacterium]